MDTTLRDGEQTSGMSFSSSEKLAISKLLIEELKVDRIEIASARVSVGEFEAVKNITKWAKENNSLYNNYFSGASTNRITWDIRDGKISPWLVLNCKTGKAALNNFNDEQLTMLGTVLEPSHWAMRFKRNPRDVELVKQVAKEAQL